MLSLSLLKLPQILQHPGQDASAGERAMVLFPQHSAADFQNGVMLGLGLHMPAQPAK